QRLHLFNLFFLNGQPMKPGCGMVLQQQVVNAVILRELIEIHRSQHGQLIVIKLLHAGDTDWRNIDRVSAVQTHFVSAGLLNDRGHFWRARRGGNLSGKVCGTKTYRSNNKNPNCFTLTSRHRISPKLTQNLKVQNSWELCTFVEY